MVKIGLLTLAILFGSLQVHATSSNWRSRSFFDRKIQSRSLLNTFKAQGVPEVALIRSFNFLDAYSNHSLVVPHKVRPKGQDAYMTRKEVRVQNKYAAIIDFSQPSTSKRLYLLNLRTGEVEKHYAAHGVNSGSLMATKFSNTNMSKMSSLGIMLAGTTYYGTHGLSLNLHGLEKSNSLAAERDIVIHGAHYVSEGFIQKHGRLGLSWGCPAVEKSVLPRIVQTLTEGSLIYAYHPKMKGRARD